MEEDERIKENEDKEKEKDVQNEEELKEDESEGEAEVIDDIAQEVDEFEDEETTRELVAPGEVLTTDVEKYSPGRGTILSKDRTQIISVYIGLKNIKKNYINVIPLKGLYSPQPGDKVIAVVIDKNPVKYRCDINAKDEAELKPKNTIRRMKDHESKYRHYEQEEQNVDKFDIGDVLIAKVLSADRLNKPELTTVGKYLGQKVGGVVITIDPPKIPRVIGRNGSMIKMLKNATNCSIFVTQNGRIWLNGSGRISAERLLIDAISKIEREAHTSGLTDRIQAYLESEKIKRGIK